MTRNKRLLISLTALTMLGSGCAKDTASASSTPNDVEATVEGQGVAAEASNEDEAHAAAAEEDGEAEALGDEGDVAEATVRDDDDTVD